MRRIAYVVSLPTDQPVIVLLLIFCINEKKLSGELWNKIHWDINLKLIMDFNLSLFHVTCYIDRNWTKLLAISALTDLKATFSAKKGELILENSLTSLWYKTPSKNIP